MAALGDSLTSALRACSPDAAIDCRESSWSTGASGEVNSHFVRRRVRSAGLAASNLAVSGRKVDDLLRQARQAVLEDAEYVTILIGTNDICRESLAAMTPVPAFRASFERALATLAEGVPAARIFVSSVPDPSRLRDLLGDDPDARAVWAAGATCSVFLQDPGSELAADRRRRAQAREHLVAVNRQLAEVCARHARCVFDANAVHSWDFRREHISTTDYFHLSRQGQAALAALTYPLAFPGS